jgi:uncharacterized protein (TIGR02118 family)
MVVIYKTPQNPTAFDKHYFDIHIPLAKKLPGIKKYEVSHGAVTSLGGAAAVYMIGTLHFDDLAAIRNAFASPEGQACRKDREVFAPNDTDYQMFLFDNREV